MSRGRALRTGLLAGATLAVLLAVAWLAREGRGTTAAAEPEVDPTAAAPVARRAELAASASEAPHDGHLAPTAREPAAAKHEAPVPPEAEGESDVALLRLRVHVHPSVQRSERGAFLGRAELGRPPQIVLPHSERGALYVRAVPPGGERTFDVERTLALDAQGRAEAWLEPGAWRVRLRDCAGSLLLHLDGRGRAVDASQHVLRAGEEQEVVLRLVETAEIAGRVLDAGTGIALPDAEVWAAAVGREQGTRTDGLGRFRLPRVPQERGELRLFALAPGYAPDQASAPDAGEVELRLAPRKTIRGVIALDGDPRAVRVTITGEVRDAARAVGLEPAIDAGGRLVVEGLRSDVGHLLVLQAQGHARYTRLVEPAAGVVDLGVLELQRQASLIGRVRRAGSEPQEKLFVQVRPADLLAGASDDLGRLGGWTQVGVGDDGAFVVRGLTTGPWELEVRGSQGTLHREQLVLAEGDNERVIDLR
jgi:hypothetical protein